MSMHAFRFFILSFVLLGLVGCGKTVDTAVTAGGTIEPASQIVKKEQDAVSFTLTAEPGFTLAGVEGCGGTLNGDSYTTGPITDDCTVSATFLPKFDVSFDIKQLHLRWPAVAGAGWYRLMESEDASRVYTPVSEDIPGTATDIEIALHRHGWSVKHYRVDACNNDGCHPAYATSLYGGGVQAIGYVKASNADGRDLFGSAVALSGDGNTLAVGAPREASASLGVGGEQADNSEPGLGAVYLYHREGGLWRQQAYLKPSALTRTFRGNTGGFGADVALSGDGNTLVVGFHGMVLHVFSREDGVWTNSANIEGNFRPGVALSSNGRTLAVHAKWGRFHGPNVQPPPCNGKKYQCVLPAQSALVERDGCPSGFLCEFPHTSSRQQPPFYTSDRFGAVYVFEREGEAWYPQGYLIAANADSRDEFGTVMALSADGNTLAVGAPGEDSSATGVGGEASNDAAQDSGAVYLFRRGDAGWSHSAYVKASNADKGDRFGSAVALSAEGRLLAVGAPKEASRATGINGEQADNSAYEAGAAYLFSRDDDGWRQLAYVKASNTGVIYDRGEKYPLGISDWFGSTVALNGEGSLLVVGAPKADGGAMGINGDQADPGFPASGAVYSFIRDGAAWRQQAYIKAPNTRVGQWFGEAVSLSREGDTLAIGARFENSRISAVCASGTESCATAQADNGDGKENQQAGAVYLY